MILIVALLSSWARTSCPAEAAKAISMGIRDIKKQSRVLQQSIEDDETIGGALRDIKSALRGDEIPARKPIRQPTKKNWRSRRLRPRRVRTRSLATGRRRRPTRPRRPPRPSPAMPPRPSDRGRRERGCRCRLPMPMSPPRPRARRSRSCVCRRTGRRGVISTSKAKLGSWRCRRRARRDDQAGVGDGREGRVPRRSPRRRRRTTDEPPWQPSASMAKRGAAT